MNRKRVKIAEEFSPFLVGRGIGATIREARFSGPPASWPKVLDFKGVEQATESCVDELLGALARKWGEGQLKRLDIQNCSRPVRETISYVRGLIQNPPPRPTPDTVSRFLRRGGRPVSSPRSAGRKAIRRAR